MLTSDYTPLGFDDFKPPSSRVCRERMGAKLDEMEAIANKAKDANRGFTDEERRQLDMRELEFNSLRRDLNAA